MTEKNKKSGHSPSLPILNQEDQLYLDLISASKQSTTASKLDLELKRLSREFGVGIKAMRKDYERMQKVITTETANRKLSCPETLKNETAMRTEERRSEDMQKRICKRSEEIARSSDICNEFKLALKKCYGYIANDTAAGTIAVTHLSRLLPENCGFVIHGASASGKSGLLEKGAQFLPPEVVFNITSLSANAYSYLGELERKYVLGGELKPIKPGEDDELQQTFRQLMSEQKITRVVVQKEKTINLEHQSIKPLVLPLL